MVRYHNMNIHVFIKILSFFLDASQTPYPLWWKQLRQEIVRHMKCIGCNAVIGYSEELSLADDGNIQLMCATGKKQMFRCL